jgi:hypothetical protein
MNIGLDSKGGKTSFSFPPSLSTPIQPFTVQLSGMSPMPPRAVTWITYLSNNAAPDLLVSGSVYKLGILKVGEVSNLNLTGSDVQARANFSWSLEPNRIGQAVYGTNSVVGTGTAMFSKKPNGEWTLSNYSL